MAKKKAAKKKTKKSTRPARAKTAKKGPKKAAAKKKRLAPAAGKRTAPRKKAVKKARPAPLAKTPKAAVRPKRPRRSPQTLPPPAPIEPPPPPTLSADVVPPLEAPPIDTEPEPPASAGPGVGEPAPDFELRDQAGKLHRLSDYRGRRVVLYFYPKDDTPGCTKEACGFRDRLGDFTTRNAVVLGVSPDNVDSHRRFVEKFGLTFPLLADEGHRVAEQYGVWVEKNLYGKTSWGVARTTFVIEADGRIAQVFRNVRADGHEQEVLSRLG